MSGIQRVSERLIMQGPFSPLPLSLVQRRRFCLYEACPMAQHPFENYQQRQVSHGREFCRVGPTKVETCPPFFCYSWHISRTPVADLRALPLCHRLGQGAFLLLPWYTTPPPLFCAISRAHRMAIYKTASF